ncbi:unnamed protein product, partial [Pleuronectes platessa]
VTPPPTPIPPLQSPSTGTWPHKTPTPTLEVRKSPADGTSPRLWGTYALVGDRPQSVLHTLRIRRSPCRAPSYQAALGLTTCPFPQPFPHARLHPHSSVPRTRDSCSMRLLSSPLGLSFQRAGQTGRSSHVDYHRPPLTGEELDPVQAIVARPSSTRKYRAHVSERGYDVTWDNIHDTHRPEKRHGMSC